MRHARLCGTTTALILCHAAALTAQQPQSDTVWLDAVTMHPTQVRLPQDYDPTRTYPLVVGLHGIGGTPDGLMQLGEVFEEAGIIFATPQGPYAVPGRRGVVYAWNLVHLGPGAPDQQATAWSLKYIADVARALAEQYRAEEVYLFGFSQGAGFTMHTGLNHPEIFTGLIAIAGGLHPGWFVEGVLERGASLRIYIAHSRDDEAVPYDLGAFARDTLSALGYDVTFREYEGGHVLRPELVREALQWITQGPTPHN
jgi:phospholipase/carboxylesterase